MKSFYYFLRLLNKNINTEAKLSRKAALPAVLTRLWIKGQQRSSFLKQRRVYVILHSLRPAWSDSWKKESCTSCKARRTLSFLEFSLNICLPFTFVAFSAVGPKSYHLYQYSALGIHVMCTSWWSSTDGRGSVARYSTNTKKKKFKSSVASFHRMETKRLTGPAASAASVCTDLRNTRTEYTQMFVVILATMRVPHHRASLSLSFCVWRCSILIWACLCLHNSLSALSCWPKFVTIWDEGGLQSFPDNRQRSFQICKVDQ